MRTTLALLLSVGTLGCAAVNSSMVPVSLAAPAPPERGAAQVRLRQTVTTGVNGTGEASPSLYVPLAQFDGSIGFRIGPWFSLRAVGGSALDAGAYAVDQTPDQRPGLAAWYWGVSPTIHVALDEGRSLITIGAEVFAVLTPSRMTWSTDCVDASGMPTTCSVTEDEMWVNVIAGATFGASRWVSEHVRLRGIFSVRSQPTGLALGGSSLIGFAAFVVGASAEWAITKNVGLELETQWVLPAAPFYFYPTVSLSFVGTFDGGPEGAGDPMFPVQ